VLVLCTGLGFGLVPALQASRVDLVSALNDGGRGGGESGSRGRLRHGLVVAEIAIALVLLTSAGLLMRSFARLQAVDPGFNPAGAVMMTINPPLAKYRNKQQHLDLADTFLRKLASLPGVTAVGGTASLPFSGSENVFTFNLSGRDPFPVGESPAATYGQVTAGYFQAMGIPVMRGREFDARDTATAPRVVLVSQAFARRFFPHEDPVGRRIEIENGDNAGREIVGVVGDVKHNQLTDQEVMQFYEPFTQSTAGSLTYVVRTAGRDAGLPAALRAIVREVDSDLAVVRLAPIEDLVAGSVARQRFGMTLFGVFSTLALILAAIGIYGVMSYTVSRRTAEFGLRMALGAQASQVRALVLRQATRLIGWGLGIGLTVAIAGGRLLDALLYNTSSREPLILAAIAALLALVALTACWLPAWRASRVNPLVALRHE
jgi:putative ABC transport system permease protein